MTPQIAGRSNFKNISFCSRYYIRIGENRTCWLGFVLILANNDPVFLDINGCNMMHACG